MQLSLMKRYAPVFNRIEPMGPGAGSPSLSPILPALGEIPDGGNMRATVAGSSADALAPTATYSQ